MDDRAAHNQLPMAIGESRPKIFRRCEHYDQRPTPGEPFAGLQGNDGGPMRSIRRPVATLVSMVALSATGLVMTTSPASAAITYFNVKSDHPYGYVAAYGEFSSQGVLCVFDDEKDGHSAVVQYWRQEHPDLKYKLWNPKGNGTSECGYVPGPTGATWVFRAGYGEYSTKQVLKWGNVARVVW